jgi:aspartyl-tRNA(Asn)/glutamyl-tRNA(Gln) amidotransferase subunit C
MAIDKKTVEYVAHLARIELSPEETHNLSLQLQSIIDFIDKLKELNVNNAAVQSHILTLNNVLRQDILKDSLSQGKALSNAHNPEGKFFMVPKIIE